MPFYTSNQGDKIHFMIHGNSPKIVVLIHGLNENGLIWKELLENLPKNYTYIIPDLPGNGNSSVLNNFNYDLQHQAEMIHGLKRELSIESACIVGHSLGGYIALEMASLFPDFINGIFMLHSTSLVDDEEKTKNRLRVIEVLKKNRDLYFKAVFQNLFSPERLGEFTDKIEWLQNQSKSISTETAIGMILAIMSRKNHFNTLKNLIIPKHYFIGIDDQVLDANKLIQEAKDSGSTFTLAENCGHMGFYETPELCAESISNFIELCYSK